MRTVFTRENFASKRFIFYINLQLLINLQLKPLFHWYLWIENSQLCLINAAHRHFITQTGKKSKIALKNFMGPRGRGPTYGAEKNKCPNMNSCLNLTNILKECEYASAIFGSYLWRSLFLVEFQAATSLNRTPS